MATRTDYTALAVSAIAAALAATCAATRPDCNCGARARPDSVAAAASVAGPDDASATCTALDTRYDGYVRLSVHPGP